MKSALLGCKTFAACAGGQDEDSQQQMVAGEKEDAPLGDAPCLKFPDSNIRAWSLKRAWTKRFHSASNLLR